MSDNRPKLSVRSDSIRWVFPGVPPFPLHSTVVPVAITHPKYPCPSTAPPSDTRYRFVACSRCCLSDSADTQHSTSIMLPSAPISHGSNAAICSLKVVGLAVSWVSCSLSILVGVVNTIFLCRVIMSVTGTVSSGRLASQLVLSTSYILRV